MFFGLHWHGIALALTNRKHTKCGWLATGDSNPCSAINDLYISAPILHLAFLKANSEGGGGGTGCLAVICVGVGAIGLGRCEGWLPVFLLLPCVIRVLCLRSIIPSHQAQSCCQSPGWPVCVSKLQYITSPWLLSLNSGRDKNRKSIQNLRCNL